MPIECRDVRKRGAATMLAAAATLAMIGSVGPAGAQGAAAYQPPPKGTIFVIKRAFSKDGKLSTERFSHTMIESGEDEVLYRVTSKDDANGDEVHLFRGIFSYAYHRPGKGWAEYKFDRAALRALWPLAPGKQATVKVQYGVGAAKTLAAAKAAWKVTENGTIHYRVLRRERVSTPMGTFHAIVIQRDRRFTKVADKRGSLQRRTAWFVPELGYMVRQTVRTGPENAAQRSSQLDVLEIK